MNQEFEFETFDEQPFYFETEEEDEAARRRRRPSVRFARGRRPSVSRPAMRQRFGPRFPRRIPFRPGVRHPRWPGRFMPGYPGPFPPRPSDQPPRGDDRSFGSSGSGSAPAPAAPIYDEPLGATFDSDTPHDSTGASAPDGIEGAGPENPSEPSASNDDSEFDWRSIYLTPSSFKATPVENPGGGRIKNLKPPDKSDVVHVRGVGQRQIPLHRLAANALQALITAARADGVAEPLLRPVSGFRDPVRQAQLWKQALAKYGSPQAARKWVAPPGGSAHQSGRAIDFFLGGRNSSGNVKRLRTLPAYHWLVANARRFGFYPYENEPWHWEYNPPAAQNPELEWSPGFRRRRRMSRGDANHRRCSCQRG